MDGGGVAVAGAAEGPLVVAVFVEVVDEPRAVAVGEIDVAVGGDGDVRWRVFQVLSVVVKGRLGDVPDDLAVERGLEEAACHVGDVKELLAVLDDQVEAVGGAEELLAPGAQEFSGLVEDDDGVLVGRILPRGVEDIDVAGLIDRDAVREAVDDLVRQLAPIVEAAVTVCAWAEDWRLGG